MTNRFKIVTICARNVSVALSCIIFEFIDVERYSDLEIYVRITRPENLCTIYDLCVADLCGP